MDAQIFFESVTWEIVGLGETIGFTHPPGGEDFKNRSYPVTNSPRHLIEEDLRTDHNHQTIKPLNHSTRGSSEILE